MGAIEQTQFALTAPEDKRLTPMDLLNVALSRDAAIDVIERLAALSKEERDREAEIQFNLAMNRAQSELRRIAPDLNNPQTHSKYASYAALDRVVRPIYVQNGFSLSFNTEDTDKPEVVKVLCYVSHAGGHTRTYRTAMPADGKGAKGNDVMTKTHATGSAMQYGMRYLLKFIFNIAIGTDDDGNGASDPMAEDIVVARIDAISNCNSLEELMAVYKHAYREANEKGDVEAQKAYIRAKDERKAVLQKGGH